MIQRNRLGETAWSKVPAGADLGPAQEFDWANRIGRSALAFRGYDVQNLGRSPELLAHSVFGPIVQDLLTQAGKCCSEAIGRRVDLVARVAAEVPSSLDSFPEDIATIVAVELAQLRILEEVFEVPAHEARLSLGYSVGELTALVFGGGFELGPLLSVPLALAPDCADLAQNVHMGILFTRGPALPPEDVQRLCLAVSSEGKGLIGPSAFLSPNTALVLGQGSTLDRLEKLTVDFLPASTHFRRNPNRWPPMHTPLVWHRNIPNRAATLAYRVIGGNRVPKPLIASCVTGDFAYDEVNSRHLLIRWTDHPQQLWGALVTALATGVETVIHVGPAPNLIPATLQRIGNNVEKQLKRAYLHTIGRGVASGISRQTWLSRLLPSQTGLLKAPFLRHIVLEDWLLEAPLPTREVVAIPAQVGEISSKAESGTLSG